MRGITKKGLRMASPHFDAAFSRISKAALMDALWCACQLGTDESSGQIEAQAARNASAALYARGDRIPRDIAEMAIRTIDSDPTEI